MKTIQIRQGDILLEKLEQPISGGKELKTKIVAYSEGTGNAHKLFGSVKIIKKDNQRFIRVSKKSYLAHINLNITTKPKKADHYRVDLPVGYYKLITQRELNPYEQKANEVRD